LAALMVQPTVEQAAKVAGVTKSTAYRWLSQPQYRQQYDTLRRQGLEETLHFLQRTMLAAVARLHALLHDGDHPAVQLGAARAILEYGLRAMELEQITLRLQRLEEALALKEGLEYGEQRNGRALHVDQT